MMNRLVTGMVLAGSLLAVSLPLAVSAQSAPKRHWVIQVHGGAGDIDRESTSPAVDAASRAKLKEAIEAGAQVLDRGGRAVDAVEAAIRVMENATLFDAGKGAIYNAEGKNELDAAIMDGATLKAGSVAAVTHAQHPISLARAVMDKTPHVLLVGAGADAFLDTIGGEKVDPLYFFSEAKWQALVNQLKREGKPIPPRPAGAPLAPTTTTEPQAALSIWRPGARHFGTVGVVALDRDGNLAAGTSTGGSQGKMPGRVGDSPILGAGTYASNQSCAFSGTGVGEYFMRLTLARYTCDEVRYEHKTAQQAADMAIHTELDKLHGVGGVLVLTPSGDAAWSFNTPGMFRARMAEGGKLTISIYNDER
jgi:L-asparaginase / beta-aspartyl-peptidase